MESSWFYWLELSCQRYWVFIHSSSQLVCDQTSETSVTSTFRNICEPREMRGGRSRRLRSSWKQQPESPCIPPQQQSQPDTTWHWGSCPPQENFLFCLGGSHQRAGGEEQKTQKANRWGEEEGAGLARAEEPRHRELPYCTETHLASSCARDKEQRKLF